MRRLGALAFILGLTATAAVTIHAGTPAVVRALQSLHARGLLLIALLHLPVVLLMSVAWWLIAATPGPSLGRFVWARLVRDAGAEVLPFSQLGGVVLGLRALGRASFLPGTVSLSVDLVIELLAKLPYVLSGLLLMHGLAPRASLTRPLCLALLLTAALGAGVVLARGPLGSSLAAMAQAIAKQWPGAVTLGAPPLHRPAQAALGALLQQRSRLSWSFLLHLGCWFLGAAETWLVLLLLGAPASWAQALAIDATVAALRTFGFLIPAAAGVQEASYLLGASVFGIPAPVALAASFTRRARDLLLAVATLGVALAGDRQFSRSR